MGKNTVLRAGLWLGVLLLTFGCRQEREDYQALAGNPDLLHHTVQKLTDVIVHDIFSPPVASRIYAYPSIAAYEALRHDHPEYASFKGQLNGLQALPQPDTSLTYCYPLASLKAYTTVSKALIFSEEKIEEHEEELFGKFKQSDLPAEVYERSIRYGEEMAAGILAWAAKDNYKETRGSKYTLLNGPGKWMPTPPAYMEAIEPNWARIRPFVLDSAAQFKPPLPAAFSMEKGSQFYQEVLEVYETAKNLSQEQQEISQFWDCNPYVSHHQGHVMFATKKITPGGHWMGISYIANKGANVDMMRSVQTYALVSVALADAFISCWDAKYRAHLVRPESVINAHLDPDWVPLLQTPPFPEYPSGHSVISTAAATVLTDLFGDSFAFADSTEVAYGLPVRSFTSFKQAAEEAAISRLYGGIHFMPAITNGVQEGRQVGEFIVRKVVKKKPEALVTKR